MREVISIHVGQAGVLVSTPIFFLLDALLLGAYFLLLILYNIYIYIILYKIVNNARSDFYSCWSSWCTGKYANIFPVGSSTAWSMVSNLMAQKPHHPTSAMDSSYNTFFSETGAGKHPRSFVFHKIHFKVSLSSTLSVVCKIDGPNF